MECTVTLRLMRHVGKENAKIREKNVALPTILTTMSYSMC